MDRQPFQPPYPAEQETASIGNLERIVGALPERERSLFERLFSIVVTEGALSPPTAMHSWIENSFDSVDSVRAQRIVRVTNLITLEESIFNPLRSSRPIRGTRDIDLDAEIGQGIGGPLCTPLEGTPEDIFGRVSGACCITGSNVAKYEGFHSLVIFDEHHPLHFSREMVVDYLDTGLHWAERVHALDPVAKYYLFMWNCLWRAGASLLHGHAQVMVGRERHYAKVEGLRRAAIAYKSEQGANYFNDLYRAHRSVGCAFEKEAVRILAYLAPIKEKEVILISDKFGPSLKERVYEALACLRDEMSVTSFNLVIYMPPIAEVEEEWDDFPVVVRILDRGPLGDRSSDVGAMELYASSVVSSDPFQVARILQGYLAR